jgi:hypothetical protein
MQAFSQWHINKHATPYFRYVRDKMLVKFGFDSLLLPSSHRVLVLVKSSFGFIASIREPSWVTICEDVMLLMGRIDPSIAVECFVPTIHNNKELAYAMQKATLIISEDGTVAQNSLVFGREECVHIIRGGIVNPTIWSVHIKYFFFAEMDELPPLLSFALKTAERDLAF